MTATEFTIYSYKSTTLGAINSNTLWEQFRQWLEMDYGISKEKIEFHAANRTKFSCKFGRDELIAQRDVKKVSFTYIYTGKEPEAIAFEKFRKFRERWADDILESLTKQHKIGILEKGDIEPCIPPWAFEIVNYSSKDIMVWKNYVLLLDEITSDQKNKLEKILDTLYSQENLKDEFFQDLKTRQGMKLEEHSANFYMNLRKNINDLSIKEKQIVQLITMKQTISLFVLGFIFAFLIGCMLTNDLVDGLMIAPITILIISIFILLALSFSIGIEFSSKLFRNLGSRPVVVQFIYDYSRFAALFLDFTMIVILISKKGLEGDLDDVWGDAVFQYIILAMLILTSTTTSYLYEKSITRRKPVFIFSSLVIYSLVEVIPSSLGEKQLAVIKLSLLFGCLIFSWGQLLLHRHMNKNFEHDYQNFENLFTQMNKQWSIDEKNGKMNIDLSLSKNEEKEIRKILSKDLGFKPYRPNENNTESNKINIVQKMLTFFKLNTTNHYCFDNLIINLEIYESESGYDELRANTYEHGVCSSFEKIMGETPIEIPIQIKDRMVIQKIHEWKKKPFLNLFARPYKIITKSSPNNFVLTYVVPKKLAIGIWIRNTKQNNPLSKRDILEILNDLQNLHLAPIKVFGIYSADGWDPDIPVTFFPSDPNIIYAFIGDNVVYKTSSFTPYEKLFYVGNNSNNVQIVLHSKQESPTPEFTPQATEQTMLRATDTKEHISQDVVSLNIDNLVKSGAKENWMLFLQQSIDSQQQIIMPPIDQEKLQGGYRKFLELLIDSEDFLSLISEKRKIGNSNIIDIKLNEWIKGNDELKRGLTVFIKLLHNKNRKVSYKQTDTEWQYFETLLTSYIQPKQENESNIWMMNGDKKIQIKSFFEKGRYVYELV